MKKLFLMMLFIIAGVTYMHAQQSYVTSKKTTVTTEKYNKSKIVALQWINLRIESYSKFLQVYELNPQTGKWGGKAVYSAKQARNLQLSEDDDLA